MSLSTSIRCVLTAPDGEVYLRAFQLTGELTSHRERVASIFGHKAFEAAEYTEDGVLVPVEALLSAAAADRLKAEEFNDLPSSLCEAVTGMLAALTKLRSEGYQIQAFVCVE